MIDELNLLEKENSERKVIPIERYFKEMDLSDKQIKEREKFATDLKDLFMLFFLLFRGNDVAGNVQDIDYYNVMINRQYKELLETYSLISYLDNDMVNAYIPLMIASAINTTFDKQDDVYILSEERAEFLATDQTNTVCNEADYNRAIKNGATHKRWITEKDERVRKTHKALDDKVLPIKELYHVGSSLMRFPKDTKYEDGNILRQIIGCRCSIKYLNGYKEDKNNDGYLPLENNKSVEAKAMAKAYTTEEERAKIISDAVNKVEPIYADDLEYAYKTYNVKPYKDYYDVVMHGQPSYVEYYGKSLTKEDLYYIINSRKDYHMDNIRLISCKTGFENNTAECVARYLSRKLKVKVYAPIDDVYIQTDGRLTVGLQDIPMEDGFKLFEPR